MRARCRADRIAARRRRLHHYPIVRWQARRGNRSASGPRRGFGANSLGGPDAASSPLVAPPVPPSDAVLTRPLPPAMTAPQVTSDAIALLLPLESASYGLAAEAVKAGFLAAANRAGISSRIRVIGHGDDGVLPALAAAADAGVALVVGPLTRDDLKTVIAMAPSRPRMLALNQPDDGSPLPDNAYALALSVDNDAAQI